MGSGGFQLSKYYFDCVTPAGDAIIAYAANLNWQGLVLSYASTLIAPMDGAPYSNTSLERFVLPRGDATGLNWEHAGLEFRGRWASTDPRLQQDLLTTDDGVVAWNCQAHRAGASIACGNRAFEGLGYVEHLRLTLAPWRLPIHCLRWGRFISATDSLVWIQWRGPRPLDLLFHNGVMVPAATIEDRRVCGPNFALEMPRPRVLRDGSLLTTALASLQRFASFFPRSILQTQETKWLSQATLRTPAGDSSGFAIHELVLFSEGAA